MRATQAPDYPDRRPPPECVIPGPKTINAGKGTDIGITPESE